MRERKRRSWRAKARLLLSKSELGQLLRCYRIVKKYERLLRTRIL